MRDIKELEHQGDRLTHELVDLINRTFVTPVRPRRHVPARRACSTTSATTSTTRPRRSSATACARSASRRGEQARGHPARGVEALRGDRRLEGFKDSKRQLIELRELEDEGDRIARAAIAELFSGGVDAIALIRWKDIYEQLEEAVDACENAADVLEAILVKNR